MEVGMGGVVEFFAAIYLMLCAIYLGTKPKSSVNTFVETLFVIASFVFVIRFMW